MVLLMSVNPGFGGQKFIPSVLKIKQVKEMQNKKDVQLEIEVDGGVNEETARLCIEAGATFLLQVRLFIIKKIVVKRFLY